MWGLFFLQWDISCSDLEPPLHSTHNSFWQASKAAWLVSITHGGGGPPPAAAAERMAAGKWAWEQKWLMQKWPSSAATISGERRPLDPRSLQKNRITTETISLLLYDCACRTTSTSFRILWLQFEWRNWNPPANNKIIPCASNQFKCWCLTLVQYF